MHSQHFQTWRKGIVWFLATPTFLLLLACTIIGAPLALVGAIVYGALFCLGTIFTGMMLGLLLLRLDHEKIENNRRRWYLMGQFTIGYIALSIMMAVPIFGGIIAVLAAIWGCGGILWHYHQVRCRCGGICCGLV